MTLCWRSSTAEQLICNQQVVGSNPIASSKLSRVVHSAKVCGRLSPKGNPLYLAVDVRETEERFPSGQREQTVNLPAMPSKVRILPSPPFFCCAGIAQLVEREPSKLGVAGSSPVSRYHLNLADSGLRISVAM